MARLRYNHPADNVITSATVALSSGTALSTFPITYLSNLNPALPLKLEEQTCRIVWDFGSAQAVELPAVLHHNLDPSLEVRWQANAADSWGAPSFNQAFTLGALDQEGYRPNLYLDLSSAPPSYRYHSLVVVGTNTNAIIIGEVWIGATVRTVTHNYSWSYTRQDERPGRRAWRTRAGVEWVYPSFGRRRGLQGNLVTSDAGMAALSAWSQACGGRDQPTLVVPDALEWADAGLVRWANDWQTQAEFTDHNVAPVGWVELARSFPWPA